MIEHQPLQLNRLRHKGWVKISHWLVTLSFLFLVYTGFVIFMSHPRLYWGEVGNDLTPALLELPVSRNYKHGGWEKSNSFYTGTIAPFSANRTYDILNYNGWARSLHFLIAWLMVAAGVFYVLAGLTGGHIRKNLLPEKSELGSEVIRQDLVNHLKLQIPPASGGPTYGPLQKSTYLFVIFFLLPTIVLTGLTMSPAITAAYPFLPRIFFGAQSARTIHFFSSFLLLLFVIVHVIMIAKSGFVKQMLAMTTGKSYEKK